MISSREVSPVEVVEACLARIEAVEPTLHSFLFVAADQAREQAREAERVVARGGPIGPLHGVPVALKDELWVRDMPATAGSLLFEQFVPQRDGTVAERLRAAGAILIGKTQLPEFAIWPRSKTRLAPESVNPWDRSRISGASSGGSAAAVAAGLVPLALGSDGGGSIRIPASLCGIVGLHPTPGRVPSYGSFSYSNGASIGPMARHVRDAALLESVIAGPDPRDGSALTEAPGDVLAHLADGVRGLRIGWSRDHGRVMVQPDVLSAVEEAMAVLSELGAKVQPIEERIEHPWGDGELMRTLQEVVGQQQFAEPPPGHVNAAPPDLAAQTWMWSVFAGQTPFTATEEFRQLCLRHLSLLTPGTQLILQAPIGDPDDGPTRPRPDLIQHMQRLFTRFDVICSPTMTDVAPLAPPGWATPYTNQFMGTDLTFIVNATGCTAASVPCGLVNGLPVGLQVIGRPGDEATVLRVCRSFEEATEPFARPALGTH